MQVKTLGNWDEFEAELSALEAPNADPSLVARSQLLFRGQSDSSWELATTLERFFGGTPMRMSDYYRCALAIRPQVAAFTEWSGALPTLPEYQMWLAQGTPFHGDFMAYEYLAYLRHHGFPSPLLDWTASPYVAAFFAFNHAAKAACVSIFAYREFGGTEKAHSSSKAYIHRKRLAAPP